VARRLATGRRSQEIDMKLPNDHQTIEAESFIAEKGALKGQVALRPAKGQKFPTTLLLEGNKALLQDYPVGTRFKLQVSLAQRPGGEDYLFTSWQWDARVLSQPGDEVR
jgi:hypothetical protein